MVFYYLILGKKEVMENAQSSLLVALFGRKDLVCCEFENLRGNGKNKIVENNI